MTILNSRSLALALFCASALVVQAADVDSAKAGMRSRVAAIDQLKTAGAVGEASTGLLAVREAADGADALVAAENADRAIIFAELAKKSGGSPEAAGKAFARQMAVASKPGVWVQKEDGTWYKK